VHAEPLHTTEPVGVPPRPLTVAVKVKVPPVEMLAELSVTTVFEAICAPAGVASRPSETTHVTVPMKAMSQFLILVTLLSLLALRTNPPSVPGGEMPVEVEYARYTQVDRLRQVCRRCVESPLHFRPGKSFQSQETGPDDIGTRSRLLAHIVPDLGRHDPVGRRRPTTREAIT